MDGKDTLDTLQRIERSLNELKVDLEVMKEGAENRDKALVDLKNCNGRIEKAIYGGSNGEARSGMIGRIEQMEKWIADRIKIEWLIGTVIVGEMVGLIFLFIRLLMERML